eukprot:jgi/Galph1/3917/GphlegSOOS_G2594.1
MQLPYKSKQEYQKHFTAHAKRNVGPICETFCPLLADKSGKVFEFASGVGIHVIQLATNLPQWEFQPSDMEAEFVEQIAENVQNVANIHTPVVWDVRWKQFIPEMKAKYDVVLCVNLLHVTGWDTAIGLFHSASWVLGERIGKGRYGAVFEGFDLHTGRVVAIKQLATKGIPTEEVNSLKSEIKLLKNLQHRNIVEYIGFYEEEKGEYVSIIMDYIEGGSLAKTVKKFSSLPESLVAIYIEQVLQGLTYLHDQGVVHRDIKGANILNTKEGLVKLADFGVAARLDDISSKKNPVEVVGTPYWMAPEIIEMSGCGTAADIWSVGCTVIELLTGSPPYAEYTAMSALFHIVSDEHPPLPSSISAELEDFLLRCFQKDVSCRISAKELLTHQWIQKAKGALHLNIRPSAVLEGTRVIKTLKTLTDASPTAENEKNVSDTKQSTLQRFKEEKDESFDDLFKAATTSQTISETKKEGVDREQVDNEKSIDLTEHLWQRLQYSLDASNDFETDWDVKGDTDDNLSILDSNLKDLYISKPSQHSLAKEKALKLLSDMFDEQNSKDIRQQCFGDLLGLLEMNPELAQFFTSEGTFSLLLEILDYPRCKENQLDFVLQLMLHLLQIIHCAQSSRSEEIQDLGQFLSSLGFFPIAIKLIDSRISKQVCYSTFKLLSVILSEKEENILMFFACRGAPRVLSAFFEQVVIEMDKNILGTLHALYYLAEKWCRSFGREWCRSIAKYGFIERFVGFLYRLVLFKESSKEQVMKQEMIIISISILQKFSLFISGELSDVTVRTHYQSPEVLQKFCEILSMSQWHWMEPLLEVFQVICKNAESHSVLQETGVVRILVKLLSQVCPISESGACRRHILLCLYYLCLASPTRKEEAALHGIIPLLQIIIGNSGILSSNIGKKFISMEATRSVEMLCWFATVRSRNILQLLLESNGVEFFLDLLSVIPGKEKARAGSSLVELLEREPDQVERILLQERNTKRIVNLVTTLGQNEIEYMLDSYVRLVHLSPKIREALRRQQAIDKFFCRLKHPKTSVRKLLLQILQILLEGTQATFSKMEKQLLYDLERNDPAVMVRQLASVVVMVGMFFGYFRPASWRATAYLLQSKSSRSIYRSLCSEASWEPKPLESFSLGNGIAFSKNVYMDPEQVTERVLGVIKLFEKVQDVNKVHREAHFEKDLGLDSLDTVELLIALEDEFEVEIPDEHAEQMSSCLDVIRYFSTHLYAS